MTNTEPDWSFFERNKSGHIDLPRAREGNLVGGFFAVLAPANVGDDKLGRAAMVRDAAGYSIPMAPALDFEYAFNFATQAIGLLQGLVDQSAGQLALVRNHRELTEAIAKERLAIVLHFEGAEPIDEDLEALENFYDAGLRSLGLVWSRPNAFAHGVPFCYPSSPDTGPGLTEAGHRLARACNQLGILLDLAHLNERGFWDVHALTDKPLAVSHACCHAICPSARNLTDRQLDAIGESGGVVGVNFFVGDVRSDGAFEIDTPLEQIVRHIDHIANRIGIAHVAFGSDFDGARVPRALGDAAGLGRLVEMLARHGYDNDALAQVTHGNWLRVLEETWR